MSGTLRSLMVVAIFSAIPTKALAFDFDKELNKQNRVYKVVVPSIGKKPTKKLAREPQSKDELKVSLVSKRR